MSKKSTLMKMLKFCRPYRKYLILAVLFAFISVACSLLVPIFIGHVIDGMLGEGQVDFNLIYEKGMYLLLSIAGAALFQWLMTRCTNIVAFSTVRDIRKQLFFRTQKLPLSFLDNKLQGDFINRMANDIDLIGDGLLFGFTNLFTGVITIFGTLGFMLSMNVTVTLIVVVMTPLSMVVASIIAKRTYRLLQEQLKLRSELGGHIEEYISNQELVKTFCYEDRAQQKFERLNHDVQISGVKAQFASALINPSTRFVNALVYAAVGIFGAFRVLNGQFSVGQLSVFLTYATQYTRPFNEISSVVAELQSALAAANRVFEVIDEQPEPADAEDAKVLETTEGELQLEHVQFSYNRSKTFMEDINIHAYPGQHIALVGPTGCGKTTIINLLMGFYEIDSGVIKIDGKNVKDLKKDSVRQKFGMVLQDTWLFKGSVKENISYGRPDSTDEEIIEAAKAAHIHRFIQQLPQGYDTILEEDGGNISIGQKQLLCIARVILTKPSILILDEATSSIDTRTEILIQKTLSNIMEERTSFIIAHRLSTIKNADVILVMKDGKIIERGSHEALLEKEGFYHNLYHSQFAKTAT